jgi:LPS export ABC transporter protein LptC
MLSLSALKIVRSLQPTVILIILLSLLIGSCRTQSRTAERLAEDTDAAEIDSNLTFNNITLQQADDDGKPLWKVKADQATYSPDRKLAQVTNPQGELYKDGKPIYRVQAQNGEVRQDGRRVFLRGQVSATDIRSGAVFKADEVIWTPKEGVLLIRRNLSATHPRIRISATEARLLEKERRVELKGKTVATTRDPELRLQAESLVWLIDQEKVVSDRPLQVDRLQGTQIIGTAKAEKAEVNLKTKVATLQQNAQLALQDPPVEAASNSLVWNLDRQTVAADQPVTIIHRGERAVLTGNSGLMDLQKQVFSLNQNVQAELQNPPVQVSGNSLVWDMAKQVASSDQPLTIIHRGEQVVLTASSGIMDLQRQTLRMNQNVRAIAQRNQSELTTDQLTWAMSTQELVAEGNVDYRQVDPVMRVQGPRAVGKLENQTIVVSGGRVTTQIIPPSN